MATKTNEQRIQKRKQNKDFQLLGTEYVQNPTDANFTALYKALKAPMTAFIYGFVKDADQADIVFSDVCTKLIKKRDSYGSKPGRFSTWIYTIARNSALSYMYHRDKWKYSDTDVSDFYDSSLPAEASESHSSEDYETVQYIDIANNVEISAKKSDIANSLTNIIMNSIENMEDPVQVAVLKTKVTEKITFQQLADKLEITLQDARRYYYEGIKMVREKMLADKETALMKDLYFGNI